MCRTLLLKNCVSIAIFQDDTLNGIEGVFVIFCWMIKSVVCDAHEVWPLGLGDE